MGGTAVEPRGARGGSGQSVGVEGDGEHVLLLDGLQLGALHRLRDERQLLAQRLEAVAHADVGNVGPADVVPLRTLLQVVGTQPVALHLWGLGQGPVGARHSRVLPVPTEGEWGMGMGKWERGNWEWEWANGGEWELGMGELGVGVGKCGRWGWEWGNGGEWELGRGLGKWRNGGIGEWQNWE